MSQFETKQVFYTSRDKSGDNSCQVPMFIVHRKVAVDVVIFFVIIVTVSSHMQNCQYSQSWNLILAFFKTCKVLENDPIRGKSWKSHRNLL